MTATLVWDCPQPCSMVALSPALSSCGFVSRSSQLLGGPQFFPMVGLSPVLQSCGTVSKSVQLWDCLQFCPVVGLSPTLLGVIPPTLRTVTLADCSLREVLHWRLTCFTSCDPQITEEPGAHTLTAFPGPEATCPCPAVVRGHTNGRYPGFLPRVDPRPPIFSNARLKGTCHRRSGPHRRRGCPPRGHLHSWGPGLGWTRKTC